MRLFALGCHPSSRSHPTITGNTPTAAPHSLAALVLVGAYEVFCGATLLGADEAGVFGYESLGQADLDGESCSINSVSFTLGWITIEALLAPKHWPMDGGAAR
jgi:hypothetical protein